MKTLSKEAAKNILDWYNTTGKSNWGTWGNYPKLNVGASYHSFDVCHCRILLDETVQLDDEDKTTFNCISDGRRVPGAKVKNYIDFSDLADYLKTPEEKNNELFEGYGRDYDRAKEKQKEEIEYNAQSHEDKLIVETLLNEIQLNRNKPNSGKRRNEIQIELRKYKQPAFIQENHWMRKAWAFETKEAYLEYKKSN